LKINLSKKQWESLGKKAGWFTPVEVEQEKENLPLPLPEEKLDGKALKAMEILIPHDPMIKRIYNKIMQEQKSKEEALTKIYHHRILKDSYLKELLDSILNGMKRRENKGLMETLESPSNMAKRKTTIRLSKKQWESMKKTADKWWDSKIGPTDDKNTDGKWTSGWFRGNWKCPKCGLIIRKILRPPYIQVQDHQEKCMGVTNKKLAPKPVIIYDRSIQEDIDISSKTQQELRKLLENGDFSSQDFQTIRMEYIDRESNKSEVAQAVAASKRTIKKANMDFDPFDPEEQMASPNVPKPCTCGSGIPRRALHDARGIFVDYVCSSCEHDKRKRYRKEIFIDPNYTAEEQIEPD